MWRFTLLRSRTRASRLHRKPLQNPPNFDRILPDTRSVSHLAGFEAVELACGANGIRAHVVKAKPVVDLKIGW